MPCNGYKKDLCGHCLCSTCTNCFHTGTEDWECYVRPSIYCLPEKEIIGIPMTNCARWELDDEL
jgi:hypothetical protein